MTKRDFDRKQLDKQIELLKQPEPETQLEKDIYNLKYIRYSIRHGSRWYRYGFIRSLDRAIKLMEKEKEKES